MLDRLNQSFQFNEQALNLRHERQKILAGNVANADTPGYKARDIDFSSVLKTTMDAKAKPSADLGMATTSSRHISTGNGSTPLLTDEQIQFREPEQASLDGNTVDMDVERAHFLDNSVRYQAAMTLLNGQIRGMRSAMQE